MYWIIRNGYRIVRIIWRRIVNMNQNRRMSYKDNYVFINFICRWVNIRLLHRYLWNCLIVFIKVRRFQRFLWFWMGFGKIMLRFKRRKAMSLRIIQLLLQIHIWFCLNIGFWRRLLMLFIRGKYLWNQKSLGYKKMGRLSLVYMILLIDIFIRIIVNKRFIKSIQSRWWKWWVQVLRKIG